MLGEPQCVTGLCPLLVPVRHSQLCPSQALFIIHIEQRSPSQPLSVMSPVMEASPLLLANSLLP